MILTPSPVSTSRFTYISARNEFVAEMSDLEANGVQFGRVYDDACDEGLTLVSHKTGTRVVFAVDGVERDAEGDIVAWTLRPADPRKWGCGTVRIFND